MLWGHDVDFMAGTARQKTKFGPTCWRVGVPKSYCFETLWFRLLALGTFDPSPVLWVYQVGMRFSSLLVVGDQRRGSERFLSRHHGGKDLRGAIQMPSTTGEEHGSK